MKNIKFGDTSPDVKELQDNLNLLGYNLKPDSNFGQNTLDSLNAFQKLNGLELTNIVDDNIYNKILDDVKLNFNIDKASLPRIMGLHPKIRFEILHLVKKCHSQGLHMRVVQGYRTFAEQDELYAQGRTKPGPIVTKARGGFSNHNYGLSIDFCLLKSDNTISWDNDVDLNDDDKKDWIQIVDIFKENGYEWGGNWKFKDTPHLEKTFNYSIRQLLNLNSTFHVDTNGYVII